MDKEKEAIKMYCDCKIPFPSRKKLENGFVKCGKCHKGIKTVNHSDIYKLKDALNNAEKSHHNHVAKAIKDQIELLENPTVESRSILQKLFKK